VCEGAEWASFAFQQPLPYLFAFDGFAWLLNGSVVAGQTTDSFTPTAGEVGDTLACEQTVSYPLTAVTVPAPSDVNAVTTSAAVTVISQNSGPAGANGSQGPPGTTGTNGANGTTGSNGTNGKIELVSCKSLTKTVKHTKKTVKRCSTQLTSSPVSFTASAARATVSRAGHVYATGSLRDGKLSLHTSKTLRAGRYTLKLTTGSGKSKHTTTESLTVAQTITID
jgi:hypothetical protein